jgi:hypothetical protein
LNKADEFRDQAAGCLELAQKAADLKTKLELLLVAAGWLGLADRLEGLPLYHLHDTALARREREA